MDFSPQDALDAAQRLLHSPGALVGATSAKPHEPVCAIMPAATIRTLGPADPPPFDRTVPSLSGRVLRALIVGAIVALIIAAGFHR